MPTDSGSYSQGVSVNIAANPGGLARAEYVFVGWDTNSAAATPTYVVAGLVVTPSSFNMPNHNVTLYAVWKAIPKYTVAYDGNGATGGVVPDDANSPYLVGSTVTVLGEGSLSFYPKFFAGWSTDENAAEPEYQQGETFVITEDTTLYAVWYSTGPPTGSLFLVAYHGNGNTGGTVPVDGTYSYGVVVTVLGNTGNLTKLGATFLGWATNPNAVTPNRMPGATFIMPPNPVNLYAVWDQGTIVVSIVVPFDGREAGVGSKQTIKSYKPGYPVIMQVMSNRPNNLSSGAVIENLVIDGSDANGSFVNGTTGILLENVCNCLIRNITIKNCDVGIEVKITGDNESFANRFEHIRMINVKTGIKFTGTSTKKDFFYTTIDDVGIGLKNDSSAVGISVGLNAKLYCAFLKATVWLGSSNGKGLEVDGEVKYSLANLSVEETPINNGVGIQINNGATVSSNQSFLLTALLLGSNKRLVNNGTHDGSITVST